MLRGLVRAIYSLSLEVHRLTSTIHTDEPQDEIGLRVSGVHGKGCHMPTNIDRGEVNLLDTEGVILSIAAKDAAGTVGGVPADQYEWTSADTAHALLSEQTPHADDRELTGYERWVGTPGTETSSVVVTVKHLPSGNTEFVTLKITSSGPGEIGLSAGSPILEP